jgi:hypothetical protein
MAIVLVVDDLPDARYSIVRPFASAGFDVRETATRVRAGSAPALVC